MKRAVLAALLVAAAPAGAAERVVTLSPHLAELVCAAGGCGRLAGVVAYSDHPAEVIALPHVGDAFSVNVEALLALAPDLVLAWDGGTPRDLQARLRALSLRVEAVRVTTLDDVAGALRVIGRWLGTGAAAEAAARAYESRLRELRAQHAGEPPLRVLYQEEVSPIYSIGGASPISQAMGVCRGRNVFEALPQLAAPVSREAIVAADPEVIVYARQDVSGAIPRFWSGGPAVTAVRAGTLYALDADRLVRATPRMLEGIEELCAVLSDARAKLRSRSSPSPRAGAPAPGR